MCTSCAVCTGKWVTIILEKYVIRMKWASIKTNFIIANSPTPYFKRNQLFNIILRSIIFFSIHLAQNVLQTVICIFEGRINKRYDIEYTKCDRSLYCSLACLTIFYESRQGTSLGFTNDHNYKSIFNPFTTEARFYVLNAIALTCMYFYTNLWDQRVFSL